MDGLLQLRVADRPGALERVLGTVRRKALAVHRLSVHTADDGVQEVVLRFDGSRTPAERMMAELAALHDVREVRPLWLGGGPTREMALARLHGDHDGHEGGRVLQRGPNGVVVEVTGEPAEVDRILDDLRARGALAAAVRTGEVVVPSMDAEGGESLEAGREPGGTHDQIEGEGPEDAAPPNPGGDTA
jgi:acetolactate synthase small subunit